MGRPAPAVRELTGAASTRRRLLKPRLLNRKTEIMKIIGAIIGISVSLCLFFTGGALAQRGGRIHYSTLYNPATVETFKGEVTSLGKTISGSGRTYCETLTLKTAQGSIWVILKPESYRPKVNLSLQVRDQVEREARPQHGGVSRAVADHVAQHVVGRSAGRPADWRERCAASRSSRCRRRSPPRCAP